MSETMQSTDELVSDYTAARHKYALADNSGDIDACMKFMDQAHNVADELAARGVSKDKLRAFWSNYADTHGLDH